MRPVLKIAFVAKDDTLGVAKRIKCIMPYYRIVCDEISHTNLSLFDCDDTFNADYGFSYKHVGETPRVKHTTRNGVEIQFSNSNIAYYYCTIHVSRHDPELSNKVSLPVEIELDNVLSCAERRCFVQDGLARAIVDKILETESQIKYLKAKEMREVLFSLQRDIAPPAYEDAVSPLDV